MLNVEIEPVDRTVAKRAWLISPLRSQRAKGSPEEVSKVLGPLQRFELIAVCGSAQGEEDFLSPSLAYGDILDNVFTVA